jgi:hypothetical protein
VRFDPAPLIDALLQDRQRYLARRRAG